MIITITVNPSVDCLYHVNKLVPGHLNRVELKKHMVGGKGFNAGRVSSLLNKKTYVFGFIGGKNGSFIKEEAKKDKYRAWFIDTGKETRNCLQIIDDEGSKTEINENGLEIDKSLYDQLEDGLHDLIKSQDVNAISLNGSLPKGSDFHYYIKLMKMIRKTSPKCGIVLDTSGSILNKILNSDTLPDIIKPNEHEIADYLNKEVTTNPKTIIQEIEENKNLKRVPIIFVSLGSKGCVVKHYNTYYYAIQKPIKAINTEGSGDSMVGGILAAIDENAPVQKMIQFACAAGTANAMNIKTGYIDRKVFDSVIPNIKIQALN